MRRCRAAEQLLRLWFAKNPLKIDIKINIPIETFEIILFLYFLEKLFRATKKNQFMSSDDYKSHVLMTFNLLTSYVEDV